MFPIDVLQSHSASCSSPPLPHLTSPDCFSEMKWSYDVNFLVVTNINTAVLIYHSLTQSVYIHGVLFMFTGYKHTGLI